MPEHDMRADMTSERGLKWAAGLAFAAVGATALVARLMGKKGEGLAEEVELERELSRGRGTPQGPINARSRKAGYEVADTDIRLLVIIMVVSLTIMVIGVGSVFFMFRGFDSHFIAQAKPETMEQRAPVVPPLPHLQAEPYREIDTTIAEQKQRLTTYGWSDADHKVAHIPIERAMQQVVGSPLDANATTNAGSAPKSDQAMPALPDYNAAIPQHKPANRVQGEGRPGAVAPSYDPARTK